MADTIFDDNEFYMKRFSCSCTNPAHALDIEIEILPAGIYCSAEIHVPAGSPVKWRIKEALKILIGKDSCIDIFRLREEDIDELICALQKAKDEKRNEKRI